MESMIKPVEYQWFFSYGGDEPMSHPFYKVMAEAVIDSAIANELNIEITFCDTDNSTKTVECRIVDRIKVKHFWDRDYIVLVEREEDRSDLTGEIVDRDGEAFIVALDKICHIHIC